jgi:hypothetical protein
LNRGSGKEQKEQVECPSRSLLCKLRLGRKN